MDIKEIIAGYESSANVEEILKAGVEVSPEELANAYASAENIKKVKVHCRSTNISLVLGRVENLAKTLSDNEKDFFAKGGGGALRAFAFPEAQKQIRSIYESVRKRLDYFCVGGSDLMDLNTFEQEFLPYLLKKEEQLRDVLMFQIEDVFEEEMNAFEQSCRAALSSLDPTSRETAEKELSYIRNRSKSEIVNGFGIDLETDFDADSIAEEDLKEVLTKAKREYVAREAMSLINGMLAELWDAGVSYLAKIQKAEDEDISTTTYSGTRNKLRSRVEKIRRGNFQSIAFINAICDGLVEVSKEDIRMDAEVDIVPLLAIIWNETKKGGIELPTRYLPDWLTPAELEKSFDGLITA